MAESGGHDLRKGRAQRTAAVDCARLDPEAGAMSARQVAYFMNDRTLLSGDDQQDQAQHSVQVTRQGGEMRVTGRAQKLTESAVNCSNYAPSQAPDAPMSGRWDRVRSEEERLNGITRRSFIAAIGAATVVPSALLGGGAVTDDAVTDGAPSRSGKPYLFFSAAEAQFVECACERLIPADRSGPGAQGAGVPYYLDRQLHGAWGRGERLYRLGSWQGGSPSPACRLSCAPGVLFRTALRAIDRDLRPGGRFADRPAQGQDAYLRLLETGALDLDGVPSAAFFDMLLKMSVEGFFSNPVHGASRDRIGWRVAGFPGAYAEHSVSERQRARRDSVESSLLVNRHRGSHDAASISS